MGITSRCLDTLDKAVEGMQWRWPGLRMAELGNQHLHLDDVSVWQYSTPAKRLFEKRGAEHVSIDLNGNDGAIPLDLALPFETWDRGGWGGYFDVVTNFGTAEHVSDIYQCLRSMHKLCRVGGLIVHAWPETGSWAGHGMHYVTCKSIHQMAQRCSYDVLYNVRHPHESDWLIHAVLVKKSDDFPGDLSGIEIHSA